MQSNADAIFEAAIQLSETERLNLVSKLMETMPEKTWALSVDDPELICELDRRFSESEGAVAWPDLKAEG
jgi:hypothetical protein